VESVDAVAYEQHLAGEVGVVGTRPGTGLDEWQTPPGVGADRGGDHPGLFGESGDRVGLVGVSHDQRPVGGGPAKLGAGLLQAGQGATGERDSGRAVGVGRQMPGGELAHEAGRSEEHHLVGAIGGI
jgi:hypothetical protein